MPYTCTHVHMASQVNKNTWYTKLVYFAQPMSKFTVWWMNSALLRYQFYFIGNSTSTAVPLSSITCWNLCPKHKMVSTYMHSISQLVPVRKDKRVGLYKRFTWLTWSRWRLWRDWTRSGWRNCSGQNQMRQKGWNGKWYDVIVTVLTHFQGLAQLLKI